MPSRRTVAALMSTGLMLAATLAHAQSYPNRPIRMLTSAPGGGSDFAARMIAPGMSSGLGQQVVVDNRGAVIAIETAAKATPDGHTLVYYGSLLWLLPLMRDKPSWDPLKDFIPVALAVSAPNVLVVHPSVAATSVKDLIALAKAKPGVLNYPSGGTGSSSFMAAELFKAMSGVNVVHIPFKGSGPAILSMLSGQTQFMFPSAGGAAPHVKSGKLRALGVTSAEPSALTPGMPTVAASGLPGYEAVQMSGVFAPAKTPAPIIRQLNQVIVRFLNAPDARERFLASGVDVIASSPEQFTAKVKSEMDRMGKVIKAANIREE